MTGKTTLFVAAMAVSFVVACPGLAATESPPTEDVASLIGRAAHEAKLEAHEAKLEAHEAKLEYVMKQILSAYYATQGGIKALERLHELLYGGGSACDRASETSEKIIENTDTMLERVNVLYVHARWLEHNCKTEFYKTAADHVEDFALRLGEDRRGYIMRHFPIDATYRHGKWLFDSVQTRAYASSDAASSIRHDQPPNVTQGQLLADTFKEAIRLHLFAAHYAHPEAQFQLGELYSGKLLQSENPILRDLYGQYEDKDQADIWYLASAAMRYGETQVALKERQRDLNMEEEWASHVFADHVGTAFYIDQKVLLTAAHVAKGCGAESLRLYEKGGRLVPVTVQLDDHADLAVLELDQSAQDHQDFAPLGCAVPSGGRVFALGFPTVSRRVGYWSVHPHVTGGVVNNERGNFGKNTTFLYSGLTVKGQSGGPIVDENFHVAGVVSEGIDNYVFTDDIWKNHTTNLNEAVSVNRVHALLERLDLSARQVNTSCDERRGESSLKVIKGSVRPLYCYIEAKDCSLPDAGIVCGLVDNQKRWAAITNELEDLSQIVE